MNYKLGRSKPSRAKLQLRNYLGPKLAPPPPSVDWTLAVPTSYPMFKNNVLGCCTCAAMGNATMIITSNGDGLITPTDDQIVQAYEIVGGYNPADPNTDQGATEVAAMRYMVDHGLAGVRVDAFADVDHTNLEAVKQCIALFGGVYIGVIITQQDMDDFQNNVSWQDLNTDNVLGGHALWVPTYDADGITVITWGKTVPASWEWFKTKCDETHGCLFFSWFQGRGIDTSPDGVNQAQLEADLKAL